MSTNHRERIASVGAALAVLALALSGCSSSPEAPTGSPGEDTLKIGVVELFSNPFFAEARKGMQDAAAEEGVELTINNADADPTKEADFVSNYISQGMDAMVVSAVSPTGSLATLQKAKDAGIPVVCYDTCVNPPDDAELVEAFVTSDNELLGSTTGEQAADYIRNELGGSAKIVMLTCEQFDVCKQRRTGLDEALSGLDTTVADEQEGFQVDKATPIANAMLSAHPDAQVFIAQNEDAILAAASAIASRGLQGKVAVFGIDVNSQVAQLIVDPDSDVKWTTGQDPYQMGYQGIKAAAAAVRGDEIGEFYQFTPTPTFSSADPTTAEQYIKEHQ